MRYEDLLYIKDTKKRKLFYRFTPAAIASQFVPLIVVLDDEATHFEYKMWNVLTPLNNFDDESQSSYWLGEKDDFFLKDLLQELILQVAEEHECEEHIYLYGSGKGGYGAILHGMLCKANAVYVHKPQIRLKSIDTKENDLSNFLNPRDTFPIFYLCDNIDSSHNINETAYFVDACKKHGIKFDVDHCSKAEGDASQTLKKVLNMLERMKPEV